MCEAISSELNGIHLKDKRLNERSKILIETLAADPQASINAAWDGWTETHAAYRFFDNVKVTPEKILQPHIQATKNRIRTQSVVLVVQDTTELDYTKHPPEDAAMSEYKRSIRTLRSHLSGSDSGQTPPGILGHEQYHRDPETLGQTKQRRRRTLQSRRRTPAANGRTTQP